MRDADEHLVPFNQLPLEKQGQAWRAKLAEARCAECGGLWRTSDHMPDCRRYGLAPWQEADPAATARFRLHAER